MTTPDDTTVTEQFPFDGYSRLQAAPTHRPHAWNPGVDAGLLVMRLFLATSFVGHGCQHLFGAFGGPGVDGFAQLLSDYGYRQAQHLSLATGVVELAGGVLVGLGLFASLAAAGLLGILVNAIGLTVGTGFFARNGELNLALAALATGVILAGPGRISGDSGKVWFRHQVATGWTALAVGLATGVVFLLGFR